MQSAPNTLFDRLVALAASPSPGVGIPPGPWFDGFGEETAEVLSPSLQAPSRVRQPYLQESRKTDSPTESAAQPAAAARQRPTTPPVGYEWEDSGPEVTVVAPLTTRHAVDEIEQVAIVPMVEPAAAVPAPGPVPELREAARPPFRDRLPRPSRNPARRPQPVPQAPAVVEPDLPLSPISAKRVQSAMPLPSPAEPIIQVTIGRLEVRSGEKQRTVKRQERAAGESLEQYLNKRREAAS